MKDITRLDANQVIKNVYDEVVKALRTTGVYDEVMATFLEGIFDNTEKPSSFFISNLNLTDSTIKYNMFLPDKTKKFFIKVRGATSTIKMYKNLTTTEYMTIPRGCSYTSETMLANGPFELVFQADKDNTVLEILYWV